MPGIRRCRACRGLTRAGRRHAIFRCRGCQRRFCPHYGGLKRGEPNGEVTILCDECKVQRVKPTGAPKLRLGGWK